MSSGNLLELDKETECMGTVRYAPLFSLECLRPHASEGRDAPGTLPMRGRRDQEELMGSLDE